MCCCSTRAPVLAQGARAWQQSDHPPCYKGIGEKCDTAAFCIAKAHHSALNCTHSYLFSFFKILQQILKNNLGRGETIELLFLFSFIFLPDLAECIAESETWPVCTPLARRGKLRSKGLCVCLPLACPLSPSPWDLG